MKYFLIQSVGSIMILLFYSFAFNVIVFYSLMIKIFFFLIICSLFFKMAFAPFHRWIMKISMEMNYYNLMVLLIWQKFIPIFLLISIGKLSFIFLGCLVSILIGTLRQFNISSIILMMVISSISHISWMLITSTRIYYNSFIYYIIYCLIIFIIMVSFISYEMKLIWNYLSKNYFFSLSLMIFSLAGIPPLLGFFPKWLVLLEMINQEMILILLLYLIMASLNFYIYNRLIYVINMMVTIKKDLIEKNYFYYLNFVFPIIFLIF